MRIETASFNRLWNNWEVMEFYKSSESAIQAGDFSQLPEVSPKAGYVYLVKSFWPTVIQLQGSP